MIPFLPEMPALTLPPAGPGTLSLAPAGAGEGGGSGLDFAGLLGAAFPPVMPLPPVNGAAVVTLTPGSAVPDDAALPYTEAPPPATAPLLAERARPASLLSPPLLPSGRNLPLPGADLPEPIAVPPPPALAPRTLEPRASAPALRPRDPTAEGDPVSARAEVAPDTPAQMQPAPALALSSRAALRTTLSLAAEPSANLPPALPDAEAAPGPEAVSAAPDTPAHDPAPNPAPDPEQPDSALAIALAPQVQPASPAAPDTITASLKRPLAPRLAVALPAQATVVPPASDVAVAAAKQEPASAALSASPGSAPAPAAAGAAPVDVAAAAADPGSPAAATTPAVAAPTTAPPAGTTAFAALAPAPAPAGTPAPERADLRTDAPSPQQQSTIDQVGDLREALRAARPAMTLHHAEFGAVSLRLEATGSEGWRAVLASRDPGFVPAIHAALADRAVMAAAAAASPDSGGFMGQNGASQNSVAQNSTSEHRSGSTPNGGQGALQPYLGQSGSRDGEAAPDHRRPSTAAALAARAETEEAGSGSPGQGSDGLFA